MSEEKKVLFKRVLKKPATRVIITVFFIAGTIISAYAAFFSAENTENGVENDEFKKAVQTIVIGEKQTEAEAIKAVGTVRADTEVDVSALGRGSVRGLYFEVGDQVKAGQLLATLYDSATGANLVNAQTNYANMQSNLDSVKRITADTIRQAEINVESAQKAIQAGEISVKSARDNLNNYEAIAEKNQADAKNNAVISFGNYLNTISDALNKTNDILPIDNEVQLPGLGATLGVKDLSSVTKAKNLYQKMESEYALLKTREQSPANIESEFRGLISALANLKELVDATALVLDNSISSTNFSEDQLSAQKNVFSSLRATVIGAQSNAKKELQNLENFNLSDTQQLNVLQNALKSAETGLANNEINYKNALAGLENAKTGAKQQILSAQTALDNARSQLNLAQIQSADLYVKAPISGQITEKYIEIGAEARSGEKIARISQTGILIIDADIPADEVTFIDKEKEVLINENRTGLIGRIYPSADPTTKKIKIEIIYDNKNEDLIAGSFANIAIKKITAENNEKLSVPLKSLIITQNETYAFVARKNEAGEDYAEKTILNTGTSDGSEVEILEGLKNGDTLIVEGAKNLNDGDKIIIN